MKTSNPDNPIRNIKHLALAVAVAGGLLAGTALAAPANDNFADAIALTGVAAGQTGDIYFGSQTGTANAGATLEVDEPLCDGTSGTVWFKWTAPSDGQFLYRTLGSRNLPNTSGWDAVIAIYTGAAVNALTTIGGPQDTGLSETMTVQVYGGVTYSIQLAGYNNDPALNILLRWDFVPDGPPTILRSTPPDDSTMVVESNLVLTFDKPIKFGTGNITIKDLTTPANDRVIPVDPVDPQVSISGKVLTINPTTDLVLGNSYAVRIDDSAIMDLVSQPFDGILNDTIWNFTTAAAITTTTTVVSSGTPSTYGDNVTFTATVAPVPSGGTVQFRNNASNLGAPVPVNTTTGVATVTTSILGVVGPNKIYADYSGNYQTAGSTSASILQGVTKAGLTVTAQNVGRYPNIANLVSFPYQISGFKNGETLGTSGVTGTPALSTTAVLSSPVGTYPITCAVGTLAAANYDFTSFADATLTVVDPASPIVINVNLDKVVQPVLVGPAGGLGAVWNTIATEEYGQLTFPNLQTHYGEATAASGPVTTVGVSFPYTGDAAGGGLTRGTDSTGSASLLMLKAGTANFMTAPGNGQRFVITGLNPAKKYDLYVASANLIATNQRSYGVWYTNNTTSTPGNKVCDNRANQIGDSWVLGNNYQLFEDVVPDGSGKITIDGYSTPDAPTYDVRLPLNGFQLVEVVAANDFNAWATTNGATGQTPDQDHDNDGVENGVEYFMGQTGSSFTAMPGLDATNTITWPASATYQGTYEVQTSPDLGTWTNVDPRPVPSGGNLSYTLPTGADKLFLRLLVTPTP